MYTYPHICIICICALTRSCSERGNTVLRVTMGTNERPAAHTLRPPLFGLRPAPSSVLSIPTRRVRQTYNMYLSSRTLFEL